MYLRTMKNHSPMNLVYKTEDGNQLWLGDYYAATNLKMLKQKNISSVLTAAAMLKIKYPQDANMNHKVLNAFDMPSYKMSKHFDEAFQFIKKGLGQGNVLVHCAAGISRSTTCILVYLMKEKEYSFKKSLQLVRSKRKIANPNYGFQDELVRFQLSLRKQIIEVKKQKVFTRNQKRTVKEIEKQKTSFLSFIEKEKVEDKEEKKVKSRTAQKKKRQTFYPAINSIIKDYELFSERSVLLKSENKDYKNISLKPFKSRKW